jgi:ATP-dependent helicase HrpB
MKSDQSLTFPVDLVVPALKAALQDHACVVLVAEPGAGKTTRVPLAILDEPWLSGKGIVMLEPRRLAARAAAKRMADTLSEAVGETVGYTVRLERKVSARTRIEVVTEGILTRRMQKDPELKDIGVLIFDEFHERSLDGDLGLALALDVQRGLRDDLKIIVMSATLDAQKLSTHLNNAPVVSAKGRMFPVDVVHLEKASRFTLAEDAVKAVRRALQDVKGSLLVFLPGEGEIRRVEDQLLQADLPTTVDVRPLYGAMALADQDQAIQPSPPGRRKIVLATTIAETSLTIEGIEAVVDVGLKRVPRFDPSASMTTLETVRVSQASAEQRKGRAGRLGPGRCYRLWPEAESRALAAHDEPEIRAADLSGLVLDMARWGVTSPDGLPWYEVPPRAAFRQAQDVLRGLAAVDKDNRITPHGRAMADLPLHPRLAHMVIAGNALGAGQTAAEIAALLSERDGAARDAPIDVEQRLLMLRGAAKERWKQTVRQISDSINRQPHSNRHPREGGDPSLKTASDFSLGSRLRGNDEIGVGVLLALAYPDRIGRKRGGRFQLSGGGGAVLPEHDNLNKSDWIVVATLDGAAGDGKARLAAALTDKDIETYFADLVVEAEGVFWDAKANAVKAGLTRKLGAIVLQEKPAQNIDRTQTAAAMLEGVGLMGLSALPWSEAARGFQARVKFLARVMPDLGLPALDDDALLASADQWLLPYLEGMMRKADLARLDVLQILQGLVPGDVLRRMDKLAPQRITVPGGGSYRIDYDVDGDPVLSVRLQEMFGLQSAPQVADGRARLKIIMLSPGMKPVAVTQSLETFWLQGYPDVRKDMRGRYPKHLWPEDPTTVAAVAPRRLR